MLRLSDLPFFCLWVCKWPEGGIGLMGASIFLGGQWTSPKGALRCLAAEKRSDKKKCGTIYEPFPIVVPYTIPILPPLRSLDYGSYGYLGVIWGNLGNQY